MITRPTIRLRLLLRVAFVLISSAAGAAVPGTAAAEDSALRLVPAQENPGNGYKLTQRGFQGIPGLARAPGGRLWATWYGGGHTEGPDNYVMLATSVDDGRTWSPIVRVVDPEGPVRAFDSALWLDPRGRLWWFYHQAYQFWDGRAGLWAMTTDEPDAAQPAWSAPRRLADGIMMNKPTVLSDGAWLFPISIWDWAPLRSPPTDRKYIPPAHYQWEAANVGAHVYRSDDRGAKLARIATVRTPKPSPDEHMIVERRDGSLWMLLRESRGIAESTSHDQGRTWSPAVLSTIPHPASRFFLRRLRSGKILLVKQHPPGLDPAWREARPIPETKLRRTHLTAFLSTDDGRTWTGGLLLDERDPVSYPDGDEAPDGRIFLIYDHNRTKEREILLAVFTEADIAAGRLVDSRSVHRLLVNSGAATR